MANGVFNLYCQDTTPGANSTFAPPPGWEGDEEQYLALMRYFYSHDIQIRQQMDVLVLRSTSTRTSVKATISFTGPYANLASDILHKLVEGYRKQLIGLPASKMAS